MNIALAKLGDPNRAFWLTRSVARTVGVNLLVAIDQGKLSVEDYAGMVTRCRMCPHPETCEVWLAANGTGAPLVPDHCVNATSLNRVAKTGDSV